MVGKTVSHYRILEKLGGGGMGVVYKAEDTKLGRTIALKVLPPERVADPSRKRRFIQEARAASALNHPNIITIYDIDEAEGVHFIAMEYVAGKTLDRLIARHGMRLSDALKYAVQMAAALAKAHSAGIVHRDLKPTNVMVTDDGLMKVLDFGLAKLTEVAPTSEAETVATVGPTTEEGTIVGTVGYMSPEQAEGKPVDARSDIFSFGSVLYEMLTGQRAFQGETKASTIAAILRGEPKPLSQVVEGLPREVERVVRRCLRKDLAQRFQHMDDLKVALEELKEEFDSGELGTAVVAAGLPRQPERGGIKPPLRRRLLALAAIVVVAAAILAYWLTRPLRPPRILGSIQITHDGLQKGVEYSGGAFPMLTDGSRIYFNTFVGNVLVPYQVPVEGGEAVPLTSPLRNVYLLDLSPKRSELLALAYPTDANNESALWILPVVGSSPHRLGDLMGSDAAWAPDGEHLVYARGSDLLVAGTDGSGSQKLASVPGTPGAPRWSPDGSRLRFVVNAPKAISTALWEVMADGSKLRPLLPGWNNPSEEFAGNWTPDGKYFVFGSQRNGRSDIWALRENRGLLQKASPQPLQLTTGPLSFSAPLPSRDGKKIFVIGAQLRGELARFDAKSGQFVPYLSGISAEGLSFSRDGQWVAYCTFPELTLWRSKVDGSERIQLTFPPLIVGVPRWSPDGKQIVFMGQRPGKPFKIYLVAADGGSVQQLTAGDHSDADPNWSADGTTLVFSGYPSNEPNSPQSINLLSLKTRQVTTLPGSEGLYTPRWSPDGRYIDAVSTDNEKLMLFDFATQKWRELAKAHANYHSWSRNGQYIYFDNVTMVPSEPAIFRVRVNDGKIERVATLKDVRMPFGVFGTWTGLAPDDSPLVLRDTSTQDIYALDVDFP